MDSNESPSYAVKGRDDEGFMQRDFSFYRSIAVVITKPSEIEGLDDRTGEVSIISIKAKCPTFSERGALKIRFDLNDGTALMDHTIGMLYTDAEKLRADFERLHLGRAS